MKNAIAYIRLSSKQQLSGDGRARQQQSINKYCTQHRLNLVNTLSDLGVSGFKGANRSGAWGEFLGLVEDVEIAKNTILLVESNDRITRQDVTTAIHEFTGLLLKGVEIHLYLTGEIHSKDTHDIEPFKIILLVVNMIRANEESATKSKRILAAKASGRKRALSDNVKVTKNCPKWLKYSDKNKKFECIKEFRNTIKLIFELNNLYGAYTIANKLNELEVQPITCAKQWTAGYIKNVLHNKAVYGCITFKSGEFKEGYYPEIISQSEYSHAQKVIQLRKNNNESGRIGVRSPNIFKHLAVCGFCSSTMVYVNKGKYRYLRCNLAVSGSQCDAKNWVYEDVEVLLLKYLAELDFNALFKRDKSYQDLQKQLIQLEHKEFEISNKIKEILKLDTNNTAVMLSIQEQLNEWGKQIDVITIDKLDLVDRISSSGSVNSQQLANALSDSSNRQRLHQQLKSLIDRIEVYSLPKSTLPKKSGGMALLDASNPEMLDKLQKLGLLKARHCIIYFKNLKYKVVVEVT